MRTMIFQKFILGTGEFLEQALENGLGGVIFFTRDIHSKEQFTNLINDISRKSSQKLFFSIDQEGGRVERTEKIHARYISPKYAYEMGEDFLLNQTQKIALELKSYGINLNFAPSADVNTNPNNPIIGERAFSNNTNDVIKGVQIVSETYRNHGIVPCIKHFPGHGDTISDSHLSLPKIDLSFDEMQKVHIAPFAHAIKNGIEMVMVAHLHCTCFDKESIPTSLSKNAIHFLRKNLDFQGVVITDDMVMQAVQNYGSVEACIMAIKAGVDMFIFRDADKKTFETITKLVKIIENDSELSRLVQESSYRIEKLKAHI